MKKKKLVQGRLVVIVGPSSSESARIFSDISSRLQKSGRKSLIVHDAASRSGRNLSDRNLLQRGPMASALYRASMLAHHVEELILPALQNGRIVVCERYCFSDMARARVHGLNHSWIRHVMDFAPTPDLVLWIPGPPPTGDPTRFKVRMATALEALAQELGMQTPPDGLAADGLRAWVADQVEALARGMSPAPVIEGAGLFDRDPNGDPASVRQSCLNPVRGAHFFFRTCNAAMLERFEQLKDLESFPRVFLHGNPHIDNYAHTHRGGAMVDFDRSRVGPYLWDLVRLMVSIAIRDKNGARATLRPPVQERLREGYLRGFRNPELEFAQVQKLRQQPVDQKDLTMRSYIRRNLGWARKLKEGAIPTDHPVMREVFQQYLESRGETSLLERYVLAEAGIAHGSMGQRRYLIALEPRRKNSIEDHILIDIKETIQLVDTAHFTNPFSHDGRRMIHASNLYAPGWSEGEGFAMVEGRQFYGRFVPPFSLKLKSGLDLNEQLDFAWAVGTQLGRGHRLSLQGIDPEAMLERFSGDYETIVRLADQLLQEVLQAYKRYGRGAKD